MPWHDNYYGGDLIQKYIDLSLLRKGYMTRTLNG